MKTSLKRIIYTFAVSMIIVFSTSYAVLMTLETIDYRNYLQGEYSKNMYDLLTNVDNIRSDLTKASIVGSREQSIVVFEEIFRYAQNANNCLHSLPVSQSVIDNTSKFLSQIGDFSFSLVKLNSEGGTLSDKDYNTIETLKRQSVDLQAQLDSTLTQINEGKISWGEIRKKVTFAFAKSDEKNISQKFSGIQKQIAQYPALIYDGPFSDNVQQITPRVNSLKEVTKDEAEKQIKKSFGSDKVKSIELVKDTSKVTIDTYRFNILLKDRKKDDTISCEISKHGGKIIYFLDSRKVGKSTYSIQDCKELGIKYLEKMGYTNMIPTYSLEYNNTAVINYVYKDNSTLVYPDQLKLKIALDDESIVGVEAEKYLVSHIDKRNTASPKISQSAAQEKVGKKLKIKSVKLAIIPTESNKEVLCYEFYGSYKEDNFFVYINASDGYEQRILQIINTPGGELTM